MKRDVEKELLSWKAKDSAFIVAGARQVGKSYIVEEFGKKAFENVVVVNFEFRPELKKCFATLDPGEIVNSCASDGCDHRGGKDIALSG